MNRIGFYAESDDARDADEERARLPSNEEIAQALAQKIQTRRGTGGFDLVVASGVAVAALAMLYVTFMIGACFGSKKGRMEVIERLERGGFAYVETQTFTNSAEVVGSAIQIKK